MSLNPANLKQTVKSFDYPLVLAVLSVGIFGVVMIYTSVNAYAIPRVIRNDFHWLWTRQAAYVVTGAALMMGFALIDYRLITRFYVYIYGVMILLLVAVLVIGADDVTETARWLWIPLPFIGEVSMQPSEFSKIFIILFLAKFLDVYRDRFNRPFWLLFIAVLIILPVVLVVQQPSLSAGMVILSLSLVVLYVGGLYYRTILGGIAVLFPLAVFAWIDMQRPAPIFLTRFLGNFQWQRIEAWLRPEAVNPDAIRQTQGSLEAIGLGGLTGRGFLNNSYVINGHNDFIFSVVAEQFGFIGSVLLLSVTAFIIVRCVFIARRAADTEGRLIAAGVAGMLIFETFFHVGVVTNLLPNTGMPFPFFSYGGSMIWVHMMAIGIVLNVGLPRKPNPSTSVYSKSGKER